MEVSTLSLADGLTNWGIAQGLGKRERTKAFHQEVLKVVRDNLSGLNRTGDKVTQDEILAFAAKVDHYCPSRWNLIVSVCKALIPAANVLKRRPLRFRHKPTPSRTDYQKLVATLEKNPRTNAGMVLRFLASTGMRINEARQLKWEDVQGDKIIVPPTITKNGKPRVIPFVPGTQSVLSDLKSVSDNREWVLPQSSCQTALTRACRVAGLPHMSHHDFRHMFVTRCIESGVDTPTLSRWIGHQDGGALLSRMYFHLLDDHSRQMAQKVRL